MQRIIELVEREYNLTYLHTDESGFCIFKCNGCGKLYHIQIIAGAKPPERQPVPAAFYRAFEQDDLDGGMSDE